MTTRIVSPHDRYHSSVLQAYAVGAFTCPVCGMVHVDMIDKDENVIATGKLSVAQWQQLVVFVEEKK